MILKPQDIFILLKLVSIGKAQWSYASLAGDLYMSTSEVHAGTRRAAAAHLMGSQKGHTLRNLLKNFSFTVLNMPFHQIMVALPEAFLPHMQLPL